MQLSSEVQREIMQLIYCMYGGKDNWNAHGGWRGGGGKAQYDIWMEIVYLGCYLTDTAKSTVD